MDRMVPRGIAGSRSFRGFFRPRGSAFADLTPGLTPLRQAQGRLWALICRRFAAAVSGLKSVVASRLWCQGGWGWGFPANSGFEGRKKVGRRVPFEVSGSVS